MTSPAMMSPATAGTKDKDPGVERRLEPSRWGSIGSPVSVSFATFKDANFAFHMTPQTPTALLPFAAIIPATWEPWPWVSFASPTV